MNHNTTTDERLTRLERSAARWRGLALALIGVGIAATLAGAGGGSGQGTLAPGKSAVDVQSGGFAVVEDTTGTWNVIYRAGSGVYKRVIPGN